LTLLLSRPIVLEYLRVLSDQSVTSRNPEITPEAVALVLNRLRYLSEYFPQVRARFGFDRDPEDEKFIELAIDGRATHIVTTDKDLLSLPASHAEWARRFRQRLSRVAILRPEHLMSLL
jgi:putative PIN family toxin of toxin-antitoxin system